MKKALFPIAVMLLALPGVAADQPPSASAQMCTAVKDRAPGGVGTRFPASVGQLYCFSQVTNVSGKVMHVWFHADKEIFRIELPVNGVRWRTWSAKKVGHAQTGTWRVEVQDAAGKVLATARFTVE